MDTGHVHTWDFQRMTTNYNSQVPIKAKPKTHRANTLPSFVQWG